MDSNSLLQIFITDCAEKLEKYLFECDDVEQTINNISKQIPILYDSPPLLSVAAFFGSINCFKMLCLNNASIEHTDNKQRYPVHFAVCGGNMEILDILDSFSADYTVLDSNKIGCMHYASQFGQFNVVQRLLQRNFSFNARDSFGMSAVHYSAMFNSSVLIEFFHSKGAHLDIKSKCGTPFCIAVKHNSPEVVKYLIDNGVDSNQIINKRKDNALMYSIKKSFDDVAILIIENCHDIDQKNDEGWTAFHLAASLGKERICEELLKHDADINATTLFGATPLLLSMNGNFDELSHFLEKEGGALRVSSFNFSFPSMKSYNLNE